MTRYAPLWQQAGSYAASLDRALIGALWPLGGGTGGVVSAVASTMQVSIAPGSVAVPLQAGQGSALCRWDAAELVTLAAAPPSGQSRIDAVIAQVRDNALDSGGNNDFIFTSVTGTPAASNPAVPATPTNAYAVANVTVPGAAANLNAATFKQRLCLGPPRARIYRAAVWNIPGGGTLYQCPFDSVGYDPWGMFTPSGMYAYTVPLSGIYRYGWNLAIGINSSPQRLQTFIAHDATNNWLSFGAGANSASGGSTGDTWSSGGTDMKALTAGWVLGLVVQNNGNNAVNTAGTGLDTHNYFWIEYVGPNP